MDQQNFPDLSMDHPLFAFRRKLSCGLLVLKLDAHLEAAAEKSCSVFWKLTNYPD